MKLVDHLQELTVAELKRRAELITEQKLPTRKASLVALIADYLLGDGLAELVAMLDDTYKTLTPLWLLFYERSLPTELREPLKALVEPPPPYKIKSQQALPATIDVSMTTPATPVRAFAWPKILLESGFLEPEGRRFVLSDKGKRTLTQPTHETLRALWTSWSEQSGFDELRRVEQVKGQRASLAEGVDLDLLVKSRKAIVLALLAAPAHSWINFTDLFNHMVITGVRPSIETEYLNLYVGDRHYGQIAGFGADCVLGQSYTQCFLFEYAATLGLVDIAYTAPKLTLTDRSDMLSHPTSISSSPATSTPRSA
ncbi:MAG: hypothetical protein H0U74_17760 [Bradymonadaceae bacterium]|nr:hypothetical protein [Lujinxingiaceae bacterium]